LGQESIYCERKKAKGTDRIICVCKAHKRAHRPDAKGYRPEFAEGNLKTADHPSLALVQNIDEAYGCITQKGRPLGIAKCGPPSLAF
jgi:hypothetical protein